MNDVYFLYRGPFLHTSAIPWSKNFSYDLSMEVDRQKSIAPPIDLVLDTTGLYLANDKGLRSLSRYAHRGEGPPHHALTAAFMEWNQGEEDAGTLITKLAEEADQVPEHEETEALLKLNALVAYRAIFAFNLASLTAVDPNAPMFLKHMTPNEWKKCATSLTWRLILEHEYEIEDYFGSLSPTAYVRRAVLEALGS